MTTDSKCDLSCETSGEFAVSELCCTHPENSSRRRSSLPQSHSSPSRLVRWLKFNFVGGIGIGVQFAVLFLLKSVLHFDYLVATAIAVETAVLHNFVWHERFTWADRTGVDRNKQHKVPGIKTSTWRDSLMRLLRFQFANGAVSILGNLALMKVMVGVGHMHYLAANAVAIALCSLANFLVSNEWVFGDRAVTV
jgi:putative flippase GtrA